MNITTDELYKIFIERPNKEAFNNLYVNLIYEKLLAKEFNYTEKQLEVLDNAINAIQFYLMLHEDSSVNFL